MGKELLSFIRSSPRALKKSIFWLLCQIKQQNKTDPEEP
jgi:hypothetical protein